VNHLSEPGLSDEEKLANLRMMNQMALDASAALLHCHAKFIVHRDIAARNYLVDSFHRVSICDFGMSKQVVSEESMCLGRPGEKVAIKWCAPETLTNRVFSLQTDVYSFGIFLWEMMSRSEPFPGKKLTDIAERVHDDAQPLRPDMPAYCPVEWAQIIQSCWNPLPRMRPTMKYVNQQLSAFTDFCFQSTSLNQFYKPFAPILSITVNSVETESNTKSRPMHRTSPSQFAEPGEVYGVYIAR